MSYNCVNSSDMSKNLLISPDPLLTDPLLVFP